MNNLFKMKIQSGDIFLTTSKKSFLSKAIRFFTKSKISHSELLIKTWDYPLCYGAIGIGVRGTDIVRWISDKYIIVRRPNKYLTGINKEEEKRIATKACSRLGIKYDFMSLLYYQVIYQLFGKWKGKTEQKALNRMYCSEFVAWVYDLPNWWEKSPEDLLEWSEFTTIYSGKGKDLKIEL